MKYLCSTSIIDRYVHYNIHLSVCTYLIYLVGTRPHVKMDEGSGHQAYPDVSPYAGMLTYR